MSFGYLIERGPAGVLQECDTSTCGHCNSISFWKPPPQGQIIVRSAAPCSGCGKYLCEACSREGRCIPWEKKLDMVEARARMLAAIAGVGE